ncbi:MAG: S41 family peptidase [Planctomycetota bacterium]|nr:S41 family peptidase [Planctomycetota bacterium]
MNGTEDPHGARDPEAHAEVDSGMTVALFALGMTAGMLVLLIGFRIVPEHTEPTTREFEAIRSFAEGHFVGEIDDVTLTERALHGMLDGLDPYSRYHGRDQAEQARRVIHGDFRGIGVVFQAGVQEGRILFPVEGSPAAEAGLRVGDLITSVDGESVVGLPREELRARLAPRGRDQIALGITGLDGADREVEVAPRVLVDPTVRHARLVEGAPGVGYVAVRSFTNRTAGEFDEAIDRLRAQGAEAVILDLRYNLGGVLDAAIHLAGRFLERGVIVSSEGRRAEPEVHRADEIDARFAGMKLVVLVDGESASASEVLAGALQDHRAAVVVGEPTYGKGMLQTTRSFPEYGTRAKVTSAYFFSPSKRNFERTSEPGRDYGILPDLLVEVDRETRRAVRSWLTRYDPPASALAALVSWQEESGEELLPGLPLDPQLDAAVGLFRGEAPGPRPARELP